MDFPVIVPPNRDQAAIAAFLDRETAKIDALVEEQRGLIGLLKEKRQALISHAVTKGLNPKAKLKDSGIEWLGMVPEHWEVLTIARISTKITNGYVGPTRDILVEEGVPYIQATHIKHGRVNFNGGYFVTQDWSDAHAKSILAEGDVLIVQTGAGTGDIGLVSLAEVGFNCHALIIVACDKGQLLGPFLASILQSEYGRQKLESIQTGGMHPHLNCGNVKFVEVPVPPQNEQLEIVSHVDEACAKLDSLVSEAEGVIALLQERRSALISAAVTGGIDIREQAT
jgi:type I restriction enzyme S subunit